MQLAQLSLDLSKNISNDKIMIVPVNMGIMGGICTTSIRTLYRVSKACKITFLEATMKNPREFSKTALRRKKVQGVFV
jgi:hypothetical protein